MNRVIKKWQIVATFMMIYDVVSLTMAHFMALWLRFDLRFSLIPNVYLSNLANLTPVLGILAIVLLWHTRLYQSIWRFASFVELARIIGVAIVLELIQIILIFTGIYRRMPISYYLIGLVLTIGFWCLIRFIYRFVILMRSVRSKGNCVNVMLIGAGQAAQMLLHDINRGHWQNIKVRCIIDDDKNKQGRFIDGIPVVGNRNDILFMVKNYEIKEIYIAIPTASIIDKREILNICNETGCVLRNLPSLKQLANGEVRVSSLRDVAIEDLLGREQVKIDLQEVFMMLSGKRVLVTGGGGSIGSELCRQIASHGVKQLIVFDIYENSAFEIEQELRYKYPQLDLVVIIGSVRDLSRLESVFAQYKPELVYHAAAHKHVPLMEYSPCEAIKNNVMGTYQTAMMAAKYGVERFVLISTDKAVNPTNIMGASKRLCEMIVQTINSVAKSNTDFVAVRFGNVLGSNGSVIPFFKKQISAGGPVTVTHPDIVRYFMTIPEAVALVLQAGCYAVGGEIFVLDMGEPVKIDTLARNLIKLSGLKPDEDIEIVYVGLRPGEKLYEEKLMEEEGLTATKNQRIFVARPLNFDVPQFYQSLDKLIKKAYEEDDKAIRIETAKIVKTYKIEK